ncbi:MAG TPA: hypothetical protein VF487_03380 [Chitinophagaceae bacterium]
MIHENYKYGLKDGKLVHVNEVDSGLKCNCCCPSCEQPFVAHKGKILTAHFKHHSPTNCKYAFETALHYLAKEIINEEKYLLLPHHYWLIPRRLSEFYEDATNKLFWYPPPFLKVKFLRVNFTEVQIEKYTENFKPDIKCLIGERTLLIEISVTHFIDEIKLEKIKAKNLPLLEIDLSMHGHDIDKKTLRNILFNNKANMKWIHNPRDVKKKAEKKAIASIIKSFLDEHSVTLISQGIKHLVHECPLYSNSNYSVSYFDCCSFCNYRLSTIEYKDEDGLQFKKIECVGHIKPELDVLLQQSGSVEASRD